MAEDDRTTPPPEDNQPHRDDADEVVEHLPAERGPSANDSIAEPIQQAPHDWESILQRADPEPVSDPPPRRLKTILGRIPGQWETWVRYSLPLVVLIAFGVYKIVTAPAKPEQSPRIVDPRGLTQYHQADRPRAPSQEVRLLVTRIEDMRERRDWGGIRLAISESTDGARQDPYLQAFDLIARVQLGERTAATHNEIERVERMLHSTRDGALIENLQLMRARVLLHLSRNSPDMLMANADRFRTLLRNQSRLTTEAVDLRVSMGRTFRAAGERRMAGSASLVGRDTEMVRDARTLFQHALRWVTVENRWAEAYPLEHLEARRLRERLMADLRTANGIINGFALPGTGRDSATWTGMRGDPIHDAPGGEW